MEPELLMLDEPTSNLDAKGRTDLLGIIRDRQEYRHITVIIVSHDEDAIAGCADRYRFNDGRAEKVSPYATPRLLRDAAHG
jgi:energy-coupling factor transporter ATP-binding protein EcfA2